MTSGLQETLPLKKLKLLSALLLASTVAIAFAYGIFTKSFTELPSVLPHLLRIVKYKSSVNSSKSLVKASIKHVWPRKVGEDNDRIVSQINFMEKYAQSHARSHRQRSMKYILRVGDFNFYDFVEGQQRFINDKCPINECSLTLDKSKAATADALLITEYYKRQYLPKPPHQVWIAQHWESPKHDRINTLIASDLINWTVSYRRDSTIAISYGKYVPDTSFNHTGYVDYSAGKTKQVAWVVSNCNAANKRYEYAVELSKYISVDIYGSCGHLRCSHKGANNCSELLNKQYRFYLAFENSNCKDYITEKLYYNALRNNIIPIVMGARSEDYAAAAPPHSYIDVSKFSSPQRLAEYLHEVAGNSTLYNEYLAWKGKWKMIETRYWCRLCMMLHLREEVGYVSWYTNYRAWWNTACSGAPADVHGRSSTGMTLVELITVAIAGSIVVVNRL